MRDQVYAEHLTRQAALAIKLSLPATAKWDAALCGLVLDPTKPLDIYNTFSPLTTAAHAYTLEVKLKIDVTHRCYGIQLDAPTRRVASYVKGVGKFDDPVRARMQAVTMFAAMIATFDEG